MCRKAAKGSICSDCRWSQRSTASFLIIDRRVVTEVPVNDVPIYLMATYYILNICYPPGCQNLYCFLEVVLLKLEEPHITITTSVKHLLARLRLY